MKRITLIILIITLCLPALSGCGGRKCDHNWERTANYDQHTAVDKCSACEETRMYTDPAGLSAPPSNFPAEPPYLSVSDGNSTIQAWRGTYSWMIENEDGMGSGIEADSPHPLDRKEGIQVIKITEKTTLTLNFEETPTSITVRRYKQNASDYDAYDEISVSGNSIEVKAGNYLYEVIANWNNNTKPYNGTVYYAFRTEK